MSPISRVFGAGRVLMAKASTTPAATGAVTGTKGKGILKILPVSQPLATFVGETEISRPLAIKKVWEYIKLHNLQNPANKKEIQCDEKLKTIFDGQDKVGITEVMKLLSPHFIKSV